MIAETKSDTGDTGDTIRSARTRSGLASAAPIGRIGYVAKIRKIPGIAKSAPDAYKKRATIKKKFRLGTDRLWKKFRNEPTLSRLRESKTDAQIIASAGRANKKWNAALFGGGTAIALSQQGRDPAKNCKCQN